MCDVCVCMHVRTCLCMCVALCSCTCGRVCGPHCDCVCVCLCQCVSVCMVCVCARACVCVCAYVSICLSVCLCVVRLQPKTTFPVLKPSAAGTKHTAQVSLSFCCTASHCPYYVLLSPPVSSDFSADAHTPSPGPVRIRVRACEPLGDSDCGDAGPEQEARHYAPDSQAPEGIDWFPNPSLPSAP